MSAIYRTVLSLAAAGALVSSPAVLEQLLAAHAQESVGDPARPVQSACRGGSGGSISAHEGDLVYATRMDSSGIYLDAAILVRAPAEWRRLSPGDTRLDLRQSNGRPRLVAGATVGPLWVQHESEGNMLWLDDQPVALGDANVVLLEAGAGEPPHVVGTARVEPRLPLDGWSCRMPRTPEERTAYHRALWEAVRQAPTAQAFIGR